MVRITMGLVMVCITMLAVGSLDITSNATPLLNTKSGFAFISPQVEYARAASRSGLTAAYCYAPVDARGRVDLSQTRVVATDAAKAVRFVTIRLQSLRGINAQGSTGGFFNRPMTAAEFCAAAQTHYHTEEVAALF